MKPTRNLFKSKTVVINAIIAVAALFPSAAAFVSQNPSAVLAGIGFVGIVLRFATNGKISLYDDEV